MMIAVAVQNKTVADSRMSWIILSLYCGSYPSGERRAVKITRSQTISRNERPCRVAFLRSNHDTRRWV